MIKNVKIMKKIKEIPAIIALKKISNKILPLPGVLIAFIVLCSLLIASSCGSREEIPPGKTKIEFWTISLKPTYVDYINEIIERYQKKNPDVYVVWVDMPERVIMQKLMASIAGDVPPDVVNLGSTYARILAQNDALVNMDEVVPDEKKKRYFDNLWGSVSYKGESYAIPWYVTTRVIMYNVDIFKEAGLNPERPPRTWDEVFEYARVIKEKTGKYGYMPAVKIFEDFKMEGVDLVNSDGTRAVFNNPAAEEIFERYLYLKKNDIMPAEALVEGYRGALNRYQAGTLGMIIAGPTLLFKIKKDAPQTYRRTAVAPMPRGKAGVIPAAVMNLVVPRSSRHRKLAVDFALFVTNDKNQLKFCKLVPLLPSTKAAAEDEFFVEGKGEPLQDEAIRISINQLKDARDMSLSLKNSAVLSKIMMESLEKAYYERATPKEALNEAARRWNEVLAR